MRRPLAPRRAAGALAAASLLLLPMAASRGAAAEGAPPEGNVRFQVAPEGLRYTGPCSVTVFPADPRDASLAEELAHEDLDAPLRLPYGSYEWRAACPSTEGTLRRTQALRVGEPEVRARMALRPAFLLARVVRDGAEVPAAIEVRDAFGRLVQEGRDKAVLPVPPGPLRVVARVDVPGDAAGRPPSAALEVQAKQGTKRTVQLDASDGELQVDVRENGRPAEAVLALRLPGEALRVLEFAPGERVPVSPGTYDVVSQLAGAHDFAEQVKRKVRVPPRGRVALTLHHDTGTLLPEVRLPGAAVAPDLTPEGLEVQLFHPGALQPFNALALEDAATLSPGRYRVVARALRATLDDQSPWRAEAEAVVKKGAVQRVELRFSWATLTLHTSLAGQLRPMEVRVFRPGAEAPVLARQSGSAGRLDLRLPPGGWRVEVLHRTPGGELSTAQEVTLRPSAGREVTLDLDVVPVTVQVMQEGFAVAAEVSFQVPRAAAPFRTLRAGEEDYLPPGRYVLRVHRRGQTFTFPPVELASGVPFDDTLSLDGRAPDAP